MNLLIYIKQNRFTDMKNKLVTKGEREGEGQMRSRD